jgi:protein phosphatase
LLLRALTGHDIDPSLTVREARAGDRYLLCSDGLSSVVSYETLAEAIQIPDPQVCADRMIELALKGGGPDNITVIIADVVDIDYGDDDPIVGGAAGDGRDDPPPPDSSASRAAAMTAPKKPVERPILEPESEDPKAKRRKWFKAAAIVVVVLALLAGGAFTIRYFVLRNYFVGEGTGTYKGEIAIFQGVPGSVLGIPLNREVQGSCDPALDKCNKRYVDQLDQIGRSTVLGTGNTYGSLREAREFINRLRTENVLDQCPEVTATTSSPPPSPPPAANPEATSTMPSTPPRPGVDCRPEHNEGGGG